MVWELVGDPDEKAWYNHVLSSVCYVHEIEPLEDRSKPVNHKPKHIFQSFLFLARVSVTVMKNLPTLAVEPLS